MLLRSADTMQSIITDLQHTMHPADILVKLEMPDIHVESFRDYDEIVRIGEEIAIRTFTESGLLPQSAVARLQRSEEHTSELQSRGQLGCRPLLETTKV